MSPFLQDNFPFLKFIELCFSEFCSKPPKFPLLLFLVTNLKLYLWHWHTLQMNALFFQQNLDSKWKFARQREEGRSRVLFLLSERVQFCSLSRAPCGPMFSQLVVMVSPRHHRAAVGCHRSAASCSFRTAPFCRPPVDKSFPRARELRLTSPCSLTLVSVRSECRGRTIVSDGKTRLRTQEVLCPRNFR